MLNSDLDKVPIIKHVDITIATQSNGACSLGASVVGKHLISAVSLHSGYVTTPYAINLSEWGVQAYLVGSNTVASNATFRVRAFYVEY